jgi:hypothetical protein
MAAAAAPAIKLIKDMDYNIRIDYVKLEDINFSQDTIDGDYAGFYRHSHNIVKCDNINKPVNLLFVKNGDLFDININGFFGIERENDPSKKYEFSPFYPVIEVVDYGDDHPYITINNRRLHLIYMLLKSISAEGSVKFGSLGGIPTRDLIDDIKIKLSARGLPINNIFVPVVIYNSTGIAPNYLNPSISKSRAAEADPVPVSRSAAAAAAQMDDFGEAADANTVPRANGGAGHPADATPRWTWDDFLSGRFLRQPLFNKEAPKIYGAPILPYIRKYAGNYKREKRYDPIYLDQTKTQHRSANKFFKITEVDDPRNYDVIRAKYHAMIRSLFGEVLLKDNSICTTTDAATLVRLDTCVCNQASFVIDKEQAKLEHERVEAAAAERNAAAKADYNAEMVERRAAAAAAPGAARPRAIPQPNIIARYSTTHERLNRVTVDKANLLKYLAAAAAPIEKKEKRVPSPEEQAEIDKRIANFRAKKASSPAPAPAAAPSAPAAAAPFAPAHAFGVNVLRMRSLADPRAPLPNYLEYRRTPSGGTAIFAKTDPRGGYRSRTRYRKRKYKTRKGNKQYFTRKRN